MAMNLRLGAEAAAALKTESARTGISQQEIVRRAVAEHLGFGGGTRRPFYPDWAHPPAEPFRDVRASLSLPDGVTIQSVLDDLREESG